MGKQKLRAIDLCYAAMFVALTMIGANLTSLVPFLVIGGVPITLQTFFAVLAGVLLGSRLGAISMTVYAFVGLVGAPVFAGFKGGPSIILSPTFGFIVSFILLAFIAGKIVEKSAEKLSVYIGAALIGTIINYLFGTNWMYFAYKFWAAAPDGFTYKMAWAWMLPPLPKDMILSIFAGIMAYRLHKTVKLKKSNTVNQQKSA
ncbi:biotin biosynthesis protein BioC [Heyndrickxia shackletonii]|uniref:Biotin transporter n=1 Tax=Heyndrickxia shackletonii TaxID=157838 RepID=A0A0Q3WT32_9BACI|nr:biotin transporter BioY [Heyndrickxia shackletonii]KQL50669.1 biotin biosynthesis protein BioC [Heyndrickxia shackletonii]NEY98002.1 biotin transporter BioY [Heyndrickxia shackletonii]